MSLRSGVMARWQCQGLIGPLFRIRSTQNVSIFVGNLPFRAEQEDVIELFAQFGEVTNEQLQSWLQRFNGTQPVG